MNTLHQIPAITNWKCIIDSEKQTNAVSKLELGEVVWLPNLSFSITSQEQQLFSPLICNKNVKNVSYNSVNQILQGIDLTESKHQILKNMMARFADYAHQLASHLLSSYTNHLQWGRTSFRPIEIEGRRAPSYRKDDTRLHVDAFPSTPNQGRRILRIFTNVNPNQQDRIWNLGAPFEEVIDHFIDKISQPLFGSAQILKLLKITKGVRTPYDHIMLQLHNRMKADMNYQNSVTKQEIHFPSNSTWLVFTDKVSHAALAGQYVLEQTFYLPIEGMQNPSLSPLKILEKKLSKKLV